MYQEYVEKMQQIADIQFAAGVLHWDQETYLPEAGKKQRSRQLATLSGIAHGKFTDSSFGELIQNLLNQTDLTPEQRRNVELTKSAYDKATKLSTEFVIKKSKAVAKAFYAWEAAREANDFKVYAPALDELIQLSKEESELKGYDVHPYDVHLDMYEKGATEAAITPIFKNVRAQLVPLLEQIRNANQVSDDCLKQFYPQDEQWQASLDLLNNMGYDFKAGRQDLSIHPFTTSFGPEDVRVTTRVDENDLANCLWSAIHEGGHALYEQGLKPENYGLPCGEAVSLAIHESQSRLWENNVGRSKGYWKGMYPKLQARFPKQLGKVSLDAFYNAMNRVEPNFIRTEGDELHYHLHVLIRYEVEKAIFDGSVKTEDLADFWNAKYKEYLGVTITNDNEGILQDVHWAHGSFGYFPTYSLGSFYAAQFFAQATRDIEGLADQIEFGETKELLNWLRTNIHEHGSFYTPEELCVRITGEPLNFDYFMAYANKKYGEIYQLSAVEA